MDKFYDYFQSCFDILTTENSDTALIVAGDFNPTSNGFIPKRQFMKFCNHKQVMRKPTRNTNILIDLIFTNISPCFEDPVTLPSISSSYHNVIVWKAKTQGPRKNIIRKIKVRSVNSYSLQLFGEFLTTGHLYLLLSLLMQKLTSSLK